MSTHDFSALVLRHRSSSGMGKYHGEWGFRTYTNARGVLYHGTRIDPDLRYPPYSNQKALREPIAS
jgi:hypothetical protein